MTSSIVFVHGTGVREADYKKALSRVSSELTSRRLVNVIECYWGDICGVTLKEGGRSIPKFGALSVAQLSDEDDLLSVKTAFYQDPYCELRLLIELPRSDNANFVFGQESPILKLNDKINMLFQAPDVATHIESCDLVDVWQDACRLLQSAEEYREAVKKTGDLTDTLMACVAEALVAQAIVLKREEWMRTGLFPNGERLERLNRSLVEAFGRSLGFQDIVLKLLKRTVSPVATVALDYWRKDFYNQVTPGVGDILHYQAHGKVLREFIKSKIQGCNKPVVLLAHSLGGIACVDLLVEQPSLNVELLITVGSQAPWLYEIDALSSLQSPSGLPENFPDWLNIYDNLDFLSYLAAPIFGEGGRRVQDFHANNRQPFPESHGAYWSNPGVWDKIIGVINGGW